MTKYIVNLKRNREILDKNFRELWPIFLKERCDVSSSISNVFFALHNESNFKKLNERIIVYIYCTSKKELDDNLWYTPL